MAIRCGIVFCHKLCHTFLSYVCVTPDRLYHPDCKSWQIHILINMLTARWLIPFSSTWGGPSTPSELITLQHNCGFIQWSFWDATIFPCFNARWQRSWTWFIPLKTSDLDWDPVRQESVNWLQRLATFEPCKCSKTLKIIVARKCFLYIYISFPKWCLLWEETTKHLLCSHAPIWPMGLVYACTSIKKSTIHGSVNIPSSHGSYMRYTPGNNELVWCQSRLGFLDSADVHRQSQQEKVLDVFQLTFCYFRLQNIWEMSPCKGTYVFFLFWPRVLLFQLSSRFCCQNNPIELHGAEFWQNLVNLVVPTPRFSVLCLFKLHPIGSMFDGWSQQAQYCKSKDQRSTSLDFFFYVWDLHFFFGSHWMCISTKSRVPFRTRIYVLLPTKNHLKKANLRASNLGMQIAPQIRRDPKRKNLHLASHHPWKLWIIPSHIPWRSFKTEIPWWTSP